MSLRRDAILREMGLGPLWRLRGSEPLEAAPALVAVPPELSMATVAVKGLSLARSRSRSRWTRRTIFS